ncbi:hypothetical protein BKK54_03790 [Rodentibacter genomosp. 1]|uniref:Response regulator n=1 Tax=Rodentibacter genomosp. 1 TaxID=1908264 RepID=A0A1V3J8D5_9PAST|nr:hypothetical protein [Rodentibacter genomosp. 1]OOF51221.1 hypothetical protein BKK54_03790 [Rodentibacter genomosp. 1]
MEKIKIVYIDDVPDAALSSYLDKYKIEGYQIESIDIEFDPKNGYESLIQNNDVLSANIIFIDSRLFENRDPTQRKFTGEEFKLIFKKIFPFIEVIVITQNTIQDGYQTIAKYNSKNQKDANEYYSSIIPYKIKEAIKNINESRKIMDIIRNNRSWDNYFFVEKLTNSLNGIVSYDELKKEDIDNIVSLFKEIKGSIDD